MVIIARLQDAAESFPWERNASPDWPHKDWRTLKELADADDIALCGCWQAYLDTKLP
jgi:hypothetical protein